jgi:aryl-alcohol dehydrogenase-like predicted oxidoreductase
MLTGKYRAGIPEGSRGALESMHWIRDRLTDQENLSKVSALEPIARDMGASLAQFSLAWCLQNPHVTSVITGASRVKQVEENMKAVEFVDKFPPEIMARIDQIFLGDDEGR